MYTAYGVVCVLSSVDSILRAKHVTAFSIAKHVYCLWCFMCAIFSRQHFKSKTCNSTSITKHLYWCCVLSSVDSILIAKHVFYLWCCVLSSVDSILIALKHVYCLQCCMLSSVDSFLIAKKYRILPMVLCGIFSRQRF